MLERNQVVGVIYRDIVEPNDGRGVDDSLVDPDGQSKFPHLWPPQIPPGKTGRIMTTRC